MSECEQTKGQSVLDHGISVKNYLFDLINHLRTGTTLQYEWKLPDCVYILEDDKVRKFDCEYYIKYFGNNAKNVIKHSLFLNKKMKGVKNTKYVQSKIEEFLVKG